MYKSQFAAIPMATWGCSSRVCRARLSLSVRGCNWQLPYALGEWIPFTRVFVTFVAKNPFYSQLCEFPPPLLCGGLLHYFVGEFLKPKLGSIRALKSWGFFFIILKLDIYPKIATLHFLLNKRTDVLPKKTPVNPQPVILLVEVSQGLNIFRGGWHIY